MGFEKVIVVDGRGHLIGRLASVIAKQLLTGQRVVVVRYSFFLSLSLSLCMPLFLISLFLLIIVICIDLFFEYIAICISSLNFIMIFLLTNNFRCELLNVSGSFYRNKLKYYKFLRKRMNSNPSHGPYHFRAPSKILWRTIRGMIPHKTKRGMEALNRLAAEFFVSPSM